LIFTIPGKAEAMATSLRGREGAFFEDGYPIDGEGWESIGFGIVTSSSRSHGWATV
jgi:hypothetical protein